MKLQDIVERLTALGLDPGEAGVYVHLSMMGPSKASDIASALKLHRTEVYRTLQNLVGRGFVAQTLTRPAKFEAAPPERLFEELLAAQRAQSQRIERAQQEISTALTTIRVEPESATKNTFKLIQGRREVSEAEERLARGATRSVRALNTHEAGLGMWEISGFLDAAEALAGRGGDVRVLVRDAPDAQERFGSLLDAEGLAFRRLGAADRTMRLLIVDDRELLLWVVSDKGARMNSDEDVAIWTEAPDFVATERALFDAAWAHAPDARGPRKVSF